MNYPIKSNEELSAFLNSYISTVLEVAKKLGINLHDKHFSGDHLGLQIVSKEEFDECHAILLRNADLIHDEMVHNRRNRVYRFKKVPELGKITIPRIEIFEPKPDEDISKLRPGIEHIAFTVNDYEKFLEESRRNNMPIDKVVNIDNRKFFKTKLIDDIEIEFRGDRLGE